MKSSPMKNSFNAGEFSPLMGGRTDFAKYGNACSVLQNFLPTTQGPIVRRGGSMYGNEAKKSSDRTWLKDFIFNVTQSYQIEFGDQYIRFYTNRGLVLENGIIITAVSNANPAVINITGGPFNNGDQIYIAGVVGMGQLNGKMYLLKNKSGTTYQLTDVDGNNINSTSYGVFTLGGTASRVYTVATPWRIADLTDANGRFTLHFVPSNNVMYVLHPNYSMQKINRNGNTNWTVTQPSLSNGPFQILNSDATQTVYASAVSGAGITITSSAAIFASTDVGRVIYIENVFNSTLPQWSPGLAITANALYRAGNNTYKAANTATSGTITPTHTAGTVSDGNPGVNWIYQDSGYGIGTITAFTSSTVVTVTSTVQFPSLAVGSSNATYRWALGLFSATTGFPEVGCFFRDRLMLFKGIQAALSVTSDYENYSPKIGGIQTADSGFIITLPTSNPVRSANDISDLIVCTGGDEIVVSEINSGAALSATNIRARRQTKYGSAACDAIVLGYGVVFVTRSGQRMRDMRFNWQINGYDAPDLTTAAEHIAKGTDGKQGIVQMAYQQEPYNIVWACTTDGKLIAFTYNREQDVQGWHNHPIGGLYNAIGTFGGTIGAWVESVSVIPSPDGSRDDVWLIVKRTINGVTRRYIEVMLPEFQGNDATIADAFYVDAGLTYSGPATTSITGLFHLIGQTVDVLANGGAHPQVVVDASGSVTLQFAVTKAQIGLPCPCRMRTMRMEAGSPLGTSQGKVKRITHAIFRLFKSLGGFYGPIDTQASDGSYQFMDELQYRQADGLMDTPPPMLSGDTLRLPWPTSDGEDTDGFVEILNDAPTPMTVISIMTDEQTNEY